MVIGQLSTTSLQLLKFCHPLADIAPPACPSLLALVLLGEACHTAPLLLFRFGIFMEADTRVRLGR